MPYNLTNVTDANNLYSIMYAMNELSDGLIGVFILVSISLVLFMLFKKQESDTVKALLSSSVITIIVAVLLWGINLVAWSMLLYPIIVFFAMLMVYKFGGHGS